MGALAAYWLGTNLTLIYAGHIGKFAILMLSAGVLVAIDKAVETRKWQWSVVVGGLVGLAFLEQQDVALFVCFFIGAHAIFAVVRKEGLRMRVLAARLFPMALLAMLIAGSVMVTSYVANVQKIGLMGGDENPKAKWDFCTQWSVPPDEILDFVAPGYMGWRSGEPEGPYWGRTGQ